MLEKNCILISDCKKNHVFNKGDIVLYRSKENMLDRLWRYHKFDNFNMALLMIDILYEKGLVNDATYTKIMRKHNFSGRCSA